MDWQAIVLGAGAAGLCTAARAAQRGRRVLVLEKNAQAGVKILMSGGTRCNVTHAAGPREIVAAFGAPGSFLHSALARCGPADVLAWLHAEGVPTKVEEHGKVFPVSDDARDVRDALVRRAVQAGATLAYGEPARSVQRLAAGGFRVETSQRSLCCESLIVATGGLSYPGSGTTGDGYAWLASFGHTIVPPRPALTPLTTEAPWVRALQGVSVADVGVQVVPAGAAAATRPLAASRGGLLFTHFGLSGPAVLDVSRVVTGRPRPAELELSCDFRPQRTAAALHDELQRACAAEGKKRVATILSGELPQRLAEALLHQVQIPPDVRGADFTKRQRSALVDWVKAARAPLSGALGFRKAEVTAGGVALAEVDSRNMASKLVPGLFVVGEVLDLDGPIGGYNFQAAFSTGHLAGEFA